MTRSELRTTVTLSRPAGDPTDSSVDVPFDGYVLQLRERTGVPYCTLLRADGETLFDVLHGHGYDVPVDVRISVDGPRVEVRLDGAVVGTVNDPRRLPEPVRFDDEPGELLGHAAGPRIEGNGHRVDFGVATWADTATVTAVLSVRDGDGWTALTEPLVAGREQCVGDWYLLSGEHGNRADLYASLPARRLRFTDVEVRDEHTAVLRAGQVTVTWSLAGTYPVATVDITPDADGHHVVAYHGFTATPDSDVVEVLCGALRHGRRTGGRETVGAAELPTPACLVESYGRTYGLFVPGAMHVLDDEMVRDPDDQPYGMTLRGPRGGVQPTVVLPQYGVRARLAAGETATFRVGLCTHPGALYETYRRLVREEYAYRAYRGNVFGCSLTDTVHNLVDLLATGPDADDADEYQASPSGWWSRAKGFIDIENDQAVRATTGAVLLCAAYLTGDMDLYDGRARPVVEFQLSRNGYGWTPTHGHTVYADPARTELCATPLGVTVLGPLHGMTRRQDPAVERLALADVGAAEDYWLRRAPMCAPLAAYRLTGDTAYLDRARDLADTYVARHVDDQPAGPLDAHDFAIYYCADWVGLFEMHEETGERGYLDAAVAEARRFVTQAFVRPVHEGGVTVPNRPTYHDRQIELTRWWDPRALYDYPRADIEPENAERWMLSLTGLSFEALQTYRYSGANLNPAWAPHLLRLAHRAGDDLLRDVAHNAVVGRFTNYPGYYFRQHTVHHMKPDFPYTGPFDNTTIYYHHAPAQLGMAVDYLFAEHETRSGGRIAFPAEFEENFVWFRFRVYGHRPGTFYGDDGVWPWLPRGVVSLDTHLVNWLAGRRRDRVYLSLTNSVPEPLDVTVTLGIDMPGQREVTVIADGTPGTATMRGNQVRVPVSGHGITALVVPADLPDAAMHRDPAPVRDAPGSYSFDEDSPVGPVRGMLLARPDGSGWDAYVQSRCATPAVLRYSLDGGATWIESVKSAHPAEWTVRVPAGTRDIRYQVRDTADAETAVSILVPV